MILCYYFGNKKLHSKKKNDIMLCSWENINSNNLKNCIEEIIKPSNIYICILTR